MTETMTATDFDIRTHNGFITIHNPLTGNHRTFRVRTQPEDAKFAPGERIVSLLTGPDRDDFSNWQGFGFVKPNGGVVVWRSKRTPTFEAFADLLNRPEYYTAQKGAEYLYEGRCRRCNRVLTTPESCSRGIGPHCEGRK